MTSPDSILTAAELARLLGIDERKVKQMSRPGRRGQKPLIPCIRLSNKIVRYHPRTILAEWARRDGVSTDTIAASWGKHEHTPRHD